MDEINGIPAYLLVATVLLIQLIKKTLVPAFCICNDTKAQKFKR
jgi:hypothetical protein